MAWLDRLVDRLDQIKPVWLLVPNALLALFVLLAHGGALLLVHLGKIPARDFDSYLGIFYFTIPIAVGCLALALLALVWPATRMWVLRIHATFFILGAAFMVYDSIDTVANGIPTKGRFSWNPVLFAFILAYPVYLARRVWFSDPVRQWPPLRYAHVSAILISLPISAVVMWRVYAAAA